MWGVSRRLPFAGDKVEVVGDHDCVPGDSLPSERISFESAPKVLSQLPVICHDVPDIAEFVGGGHSLLSTWSDSRAPHRTMWPTPGCTRLTTETSLRLAAHTVG